MSPRKDSPVRPRRARATAVSRRRFIKLLAAGASVALAAPVATLAAEKSAPRSRPAPAAKPAARAALPAGRAVSARELEKQKQYVEEALKAIRAFPLPPGSDPAFVFRPMRRGRKGR